MKSISTDHCDKGVSISKTNKELKTSPIYMPMPQKRKQDLHWIASATKGHCFHFLETAESLHRSTVNGIAAFCSQDACAFQKERDIMKITLNLDCKLFPCIFKCGFILFGFLCVVFHYHYQKEEKIPTLHGR